MNPPLERINASKNAFDAGPKLCVCSISAVGENSGRYMNTSRGFRRLSFQSLVLLVRAEGVREGLREAMVEIGKKGENHRTDTSVFVVVYDFYF